MSDFRVFETVQFLDDLEKISSLVYPQLREQPYFGTNIKKLKGFKPETWRYRIGSYRFFYIVNDKEKIVFMVAADTRQQSY
ncbi:MAG: type II toxin-antitoxin system RelE/ParE family toxin [Candidatus Aminicenantes bacterium]|nr:type II toxin-antitoxin system RelE/ParE family toxin [Candidatus Aminicenantes bacterium]